MALNTNITNGPRSFRDLGSERARTAKAITKALKAKTPEQAALDRLERTIRALPPRATRKEWSYASIDWVDYYIPRADPNVWTWGGKEAPAIVVSEQPEPARFDHYRVSLGKRLGKWIGASEHMQQETLALPPLPPSFLFRVEHAHMKAHRSQIFHAGPYADRVARLEDVPYTKVIDGVDTTPAPSDDELLMAEFRRNRHSLRSSCYFGFRSLEALKRWFDSPKFYASAAAAGYVVRRYKGVVFHGGFQSVIDSKYPVERVDTLQPW